MDFELSENYTIEDVVRGGYNVGRFGKFWRHFNDFDAAFTAIKADMVDQGFYGDVYFVNERGSVDLLDDKGNFVD